MKKLKFIDIIIILFYIAFFICVIYGEKLDKLYPNSTYFIVFILILISIFDCIRIIKNNRYKTKYLILACKILWGVSLIILFYYYKLTPFLTDNPTSEYISNVISITSKARKYRLLGVIALLLEQIFKLKRFENTKEELICIKD